MRKVAILLVMVVGISLLIWAGVHNRRASQKAMQEASANRVTLTKDTPSQTTAMSPSGTITGTFKGKPAPAFTLVNSEGKKVSLADYKGRPVLINFWATWCAPCKLEMPWFEEFRQKYGPQGFEILGISEDDSPKEDIAKAVKRINVTYPILLTDGKVAPAYGGVDYLPESFYVGRDGVVQIQSSGLASKDEVEANIKRLIAGGNTAPANSVAAAAPHPAAMLLPSAASTH